jgi:hypothetical protein
MSMLKTYSVALLAVTFMELCLQRSLIAQPGIDQCPVPDLPIADSAIYAMRYGVPDQPFELDSAVWAITRISTYFDPTSREEIQGLVERYGAPMLAKSFLEIISLGAPYFVRSDDRRQVAVFYGQMHRDYPEFLPLAPLPDLLLKHYYHDEVKVGLVLAMTYIEETSHEANLALSTVLCQTAFHVRPFVHASSDIATPTSTRELGWYSTARTLLIATVQALAARPGGMEIIERHLAQETNPALANAIRGWAAT